MSKFSILARQAKESNFEQLNQRILTLEKQTKHQQDGLSISNLQTLHALRDCTSEMLFVDFDKASRMDLDVAVWKRGIYPAVDAFRFNISEAVKLGKGQARELIQRFQTFLMGSIEFLEDLKLKFIKKHRLTRAAKLCGHEINSVKDDVDEKRENMVVYRFLINLGDLERYRVQFGPKASSDYTLALKWYSMAQLLLPQVGTAYNQMAVLHQSLGINHLALNNYLRAIVCRDEFATARANVRNMCKQYQKNPLNMIKRPSGFWRTDNDEKMAARVLLGMVDAVWNSEGNLEKLDIFASFMLPLNADAAEEILVCSFSVILSLFHIAHRRKKEAPNVYEPTVFKSSSELRNCLFKIALEWTERVLDLFTLTFANHEATHVGAVVCNVALRWLLRILAEPQRFFLPDDLKEPMHRVMRLVQTLRSANPQLTVSMDSFDGFAALDSTDLHDGLIELCRRVTSFSDEIEIDKNSAEAPLEYPSLKQLLVPSQVYVPETSEFIMFSGRKQRAPLTEAAQLQTHDRQASDEFSIDTMAFLGL
jgi:hypothetical protein